MYCVCVQNCSFTVQRKKSFVYLKQVCDIKRYLIGLKAQKNDNFGISSLKFNGLMYSDSSSKSEILNKQFQSVFTKKSTTATPRLFGNKYPSIENLSITLKGVQKL